MAFGEVGTSLSKIKANSLNLAGTYGFSGTVTGFDDTPLVLLTESSISAGTANVDFTSNINSTYKEYLFIFNNIHVTTNGEATFGFQVSTNGGTSYGVSCQSTMISNFNNEVGDSNGFIHYNGGALDTSTDTQIFTSGGNGNDNDQCVSGLLKLYNPSSTTFQKHFASMACNYQDSDYINGDYVMGYFNTTSAINAVRFIPGRLSAATNLDDGVIQMFGVS